MNNLTPINNENIFFMNKQGQLFRYIGKTKRGRALYKQLKVYRMRNNGYETVRIRLNGVLKSRYVHILMRKTFMNNSDKSLVINHKNKLKYDNRLRNLEVVTRSFNGQHGPSNHRGNIPVPVIAIYNNIRKSFKSLTDAADFIGGTPHGVSKVLCGYLYTYKGWTFERI